MPHDLSIFLKRLNDTLVSEYERIQRWVLEDPGTAGDEGEENWAQFLRGLLPKTYSVVTKGRIMGADGQLSRQVDVVVLKPSYPPHLASTKIYLAAGVAAAFECKLKVKRHHFAEVVRQSRSVKALLRTNVDAPTPFTELRSPIVTGLLAHTHALKGKKSRAEEKISELLTTIVDEAEHPYELPDIVCVADIGTWSSHLRSCVTEAPNNDELKLGEERVGFAYLMSTVEGSHAPEVFSPMAQMFCDLFRKIAWHDSSMREMSDFYDRAIVVETASGDERCWDARDIYTAEVAAEITRRRTGLPSLGSDAVLHSPRWDEWSSEIF